MCRRVDYTVPVMKLLLPLVLIGLVACGGDDDDDDGADGADAGINCDFVMEGQDTYAPGLEKIGAGGYTVRLMSATPAPPAKGDNDWTIEVLDDTSTATDGLDIDVKPFMPLHGHGTPIPAEVTAGGAPGTYNLNPVNMFMPGIWEITLDIGDGTTVEDSVMYKFCIDG